MIVNDTRRIILVDGSRLVLQMLKRVFGKSKRLEVVGEGLFSDTEKMIQATDPDWVIINIDVDGKDKEAINEMIQAYPKVRFLTVSKDGSQVQMKWLEAHEENLSGLSLSEILKVLVDRR